MQDQLIAELLRLGSTGSMAALFVWLLFTTHNEARKREERLHTLIDKLTTEIAQLRDEVRQINK